MDNIFDYKNEYKKLYLPKTVPVTINVPEITFVVVDGNSDPNDKTAVGLWPMAYGLWPMAYGLCAVFLRSKYRMQPVRYV
ncbi:MAG: hypothetical protein LBK05_08930 [Treponema sp.]|nr:hypothetical protein [Treponema sp.]